MPEFDPSELTKEKNLFQIYLLSRKIPRSRLHTWTPILIGFVVAVHGMASKGTALEIIERARDWTQAGFGFSVAILGFLLAGFAIFATMMKSDLALEMARIEHKKSGLSYLKYNFAAFFDVFIKYLLFAFLYVGLLVFGYTGGLLESVIGSVPGVGALEKKAFASLSLGVVGGFLFHLLFILQSFVFNVYHVVMTIVRWEAEQAETGDG